MEDKRKARTRIKRKRRKERTRRRRVKKAGGLGLKEMKRALASSSQ
jgi:hypothetical protein